MMAKVLRMPEVAESVVEGEITRWIKQEGERVEKNEPIVEVMTEKVTVEVPSPYEGVVARILVPEGEVVAVHTPIAVIAEADEDPASLDIQALLGGKVPASSKEEAPASQEAPSHMHEAVAAQAQKVAEESVGARMEEGELRPPRIPGKILATPAARKAAREMGVDLAEVPTSSPVGRITKDDVLAYAQTRERKVEEVGVSERPFPSGYAPPAPEPTERIPFRGLRREIARRLRESKDQAVHTLHVDEADLTELVRLRERLKSHAAETGTKLTYLPFVIKAVVAALRRHPTFNATVDDERGEIVLHRTYNIGIAVATDQGLVVPVIHRAESKSILELAAEVSEKAERARQGRLTMEDITGGTFSITNIGSIGGLFSFPVINYPQVAILGFHSIKKRPVVMANGEMVVRDMVYLSLAFDHRVVDGAQAALFTREVIRLLENPDLLMLEG